MRGGLLGPRVIMHYVVLRIIPTTSHNLHRFTAKTITNLQAHKHINCGIIFTPFLELLYTTSHNRPYKL